MLWHFIDFLLIPFFFRLFFSPSLLFSLTLTCKTHHAIKPSYTYALDFRRHSLHISVTSIFFCLRVYWHAVTTTRAWTSARPISAESVMYWTNLANMIEGNDCVIQHLMYKMTLCSWFKGLYWLAFNLKIRPLGIMLSKEQNTLESAFRGK